MTMLQMSIRNWRKERKSNSRTACLLIGLLSSWPYTDRNFPAVHVIKRPEWLQSREFFQCKHLIHCNFAYRNDKNIFMHFQPSPATIQIIYYALHLHVAPLCSANLLSSQFKREEIIIPEWMQTVIEHFSPLSLHERRFLLFAFLKSLLLMRRRNDEATYILSVGIISFMSLAGPFFIDRHAHIVADFHIETPEGRQETRQQFENYLNWNGWCLQMKRKEL